MILKEPGGSKMLGNDIYDLDWWFYVIWNRFLALNRQIFHLRSWKMLRIIINRMSQQSILVLMDNDRDFHCDFVFVPHRIFQQWSCIFSLIICYFPRKGIVFHPCPFPMAQVISAEDIKGYPVTEWISAHGSPE